LKQKVIDLRKSNVIFGADRHPMTSIHRSDFNSKQALLLPPANDNVAIRRTNFCLGDTKPEFESMSQAYFIHHTNAEKPVSNKELAIELRATHFVLGGEQPSYSSNTGAAFKKPPTDFKPPQILNPHLQANHFSLAQIGDRMANTTTYSSTIIDHGPQPVNSMQDARRDAKTSFIIGTQKPGFVSEAQENYVKQNGKPADLEANVKADLRRSHFHFNDVKPQYQSLVQASYTAKDLPKQENISVKMSTQLRMTTFHLGQAAPTYTSSSHAALGNVQGKPAMLDPVLAKDLRSHHFAHGNGKWNQQNVTEYKENFFWKDQAE